VRLVRCRFDGNVYAMKQLKKTRVLTEREAAFFREERDVMAQTTSPWLVTLHYAFQTHEHLFLVMEYIQVRCGSRRESPFPPPAQRRTGWQPLQPAVQVRRAGGDRRPLLPG
jgi:serine/threonine protein kinase